MFATLIICVIFVFFFKYWRFMNVIKKTKQNRATKMSMAGIFLILFIFITSIVCEVLLLKDLEKKYCEDSSSNSNNNNHNNYNYNNNLYNDNYSNSNKKNSSCKDDYSSADKDTAIASFTFIQFFSIFNFIFFCMLNFRISLGIVDPNQSNDKKSEISNEIPYNVDPENQVNDTPNSQVNPQVNIVQIQINNPTQNNNQKDNQNNMINNHKMINKKIKNKTNNVNKQTIESNDNSSNYQMTRIYSDSGC